MIEMTRSNNLIYIIAKRYEDRGMTLMMKIKNERGVIMTEVRFKVDAEQKDNYEKAKKLLLETDEAIRALTFEEQQKLAYEFAQYKGIYSLYQMM